MYNKNNERPVQRQEQNEEDPTLSGRYSRNLIPGKIGAQEQKKLNSARVLVAGLGGLGSAVIANLACLGFENLGILDSDKVEVTNLNRQFIHKESNIGKLKTDSAVEFIKSFNSNIKITTHAVRLERDDFNGKWKMENGKLDEKNNYPLSIIHYPFSTDEEILGNYDYVLDCFDNWESKFLLNEECVRLNKTLIHAGAEGLRGQVMTIKPGKTCCLSCIFNDGGLESPPYTRKSQDAEPQKEVIAPIVNIIGSIAVYELVENILNQDYANGTILRYDLNNNTLKKSYSEKNKRCSVCSKCKN